MMLDISFNAGGELSVELTMQTFGGTAGNDTWRQIFEQFDSIRIRAEGCKLVQDEADPKDIFINKYTSKKVFIME